VSVKAEENSIHADAIKEYTTNEEIKKITYAAASVESEYYCKAPRVEEIVRFARKMGYKKIGIATCIGLIEETKLFAKVLEAADLVPYGVICKVGRVDKPQIGIPEEWKIHPGGFEAMCNPILQAMMLNKEETDINVIVGLCVGHDILFTKYSEAPVTTLIVKDRVMAHNPAGALHTLGTYNKRLLEL
jgi:uncharacterized metal-binding protein